MAIVDFGGSENEEDKWLEYLRELRRQRPRTIRDRAREVLEGRGFGPYGDEDDAQAYEMAGGLAAAPRFGPDPVQGEFGTDGAGTGEPGRAISSLRTAYGAPAQGRAGKTGSSAAPAPGSGQTGPASREAINRAREAAIPRIKAFIGSRDISEGVPEDGAAAVYNTITGKTRYLYGPEAGRPDGKNKFRYSIDVVKGDIIVVLGHSHPKQSRRNMKPLDAQRIDRENEGISHNYYDKMLVRRFGVLVIKTPSGKVKVCRRKGRYDYSCQ